jgi:predicted PurR-regulated permease PerM
MEHLQDHKINRYIFLGAILVFAIFLMYSLMAFFTAFLGAIMFYVLSKSPVQWLVVRRKWRRSWAALLVIITSFFIILLPITLLGGMMYQKVSSVAANFSTIIEPLTHIDELLREKFDFILLSEKNIAQLQTFVTDFLSSALNQGINLFSSIIMMYFFLYFMIMNTGRMEAAIVFYLPFKRSQIALFGTELRAQTFSNAIGVPLIAVVQGFVAYISLLITGMDEPVFWAIVTGFTSVIPIVGTGLVWVPIGIYMLIIGQTWQGIFLFGWGSIILSTMDNVVRFLLAKKMADVHPIVTVLGVIIGLHYFGITGLIFGPLLISYFIILLRIYYQEYQPQKNPRKKTNTQSFNLPFLGRKKV